MKSSSVIKVSIIPWYVYLLQEMRTCWKIGNKVQDCLVLHQREVVFQGHK